MLTEKQLAMLKPFLGANMFKEYGVRELARAANEKSNNAVQIALRKFVKENIVNIRNSGTSKLYRINLDNDLSYDYLELLKYEGLSKEIIYSIEALKKEIEKYNLFYSLAIFGSYAAGKQNKKSDLDIAVFIPDKNIESKIKIASKMAEINSLVPLHVQIIPDDDFFEMLVNKEANVGKEIAMNHRTIYNLKAFYKTIKKASEHGYKY